MLSLSHMTRCQGSTGHHCHTEEKICLLCQENPNPNSQRHRPCVPGCSCMWQLCRWRCCYSHHGHVRLRWGDLARPQSILKWVGWLKGFHSILVYSHLLHMLRRGCHHPQFVTGFVRNISIGGQREDTSGQRSSSQTWTRTESRGWRSPPSWAWGQDFLRPRPGSSFPSCKLGGCWLLHLAWTSFRSGGSCRQSWQSRHC